MNQSDIDDMHCTIVWSPSGSVPNPKPIARSYAARCVRIEAWPGHNGDGYLVAILNSDSMQTLHKTWKLRGAEHTFNDYVPHVTLKTPYQFSQDSSNPLWDKLYKVRTILETSPMLIRLVDEQVQDAKNPNK
jgi:hypothetical protein